MATVVLALGSGCGLKGPLTMPERSSNIVIRGPSGEVAEGAGTPASPAAGDTPGSTTTPAPTSPVDDGSAPPTGTSPASKKPAADPDRMPPPPLPGGDPGSSQGG